MGLGPALETYTITLEWCYLIERQVLILMSGKQWMLLVLALVLGGLSFYLNHDWSGRNKVRVHHRSRPPVPGDGRSTIQPLFFAFDRDLKLTSLKVIPLHEIETNKYPHPIWHLVSKSSSVPVSDFTYGCAIGGMEPAVNGATADPLEPGVTYRLLVEAGPLKLQDDFVPLARSQ